jgi:hypothetical protein
MQTHENALFTATEAAVLTRLSVKAVNNAIDKKTIPAVTGKRAGHATRLLDLHALISLTLERRLADRFVPELRREVFDALATAPRNRVSLEGGFLTIDLRAARARDIAAHAAPRPRCRRQGSRQHGRRPRISGHSRSSTSDRDACRAGFDRDGPA